MVSPNWTAGQQPISGYTLNRCIGKGAFGEVWEATGPRGLLIALKRVLLEKSIHHATEEMEAHLVLEDVRNPYLLSIHGKWLIDESLIIGYALSEKGLSQLTSGNVQIKSEIALEAETNPLFENAADALDYFSQSIRHSICPGIDAKEISEKTIDTTPASTPSAAPLSVHDRLSRIRKPRRPPMMTYEPLTSDPAKISLPFIVGVMGDFAGHSSRKSEPLERRRFIQIDRDNFNEVMSRFAPELHLQVGNSLEHGDEPLNVHLRFQSMQDFQPAFVLNQVEPLRTLLEKRAKYSELSSYTDRAFGPDADQSEIELPLKAEGLLHELFPDGAHWNGELRRKLSIEIARLDAVMSDQLAAIMHTVEFQKLEGCWRGLQYLVYNSETGPELKLKVLNITKRELLEDLNTGSAPDVSQIFHKIYTNTFAVPGGWPFGAIVGDYEFQNHPDDIALLRNLSFVAAASFCPFLSSVGCEMFGFDSWTELNKPRDLAKIFDTPSYANWKSFRESEDSRFVVLTMPRTLARLPYGANTKPIDEFGFEEVPLGADGTPIAVANEEYCWMNTAYVMGARLTDAFAKHGWCTLIRGFEGGGKVENLPTHIVRTEDGDLEIKCPNEVLIPGRKEKEISDAGFLPLCNYRDTDYAVFFGGQSIQKPKRYVGVRGDEATINAAIVSRLPYTLATSRIAHHIKLMTRDVGSFMEQEELEKWLRNWIKNYVTASDNPSVEEKATHPLADARIEVLEVPGQPGRYNAIALLRPWLHFEELSLSMRLVIRLPFLHW